MCVWKMIPQIKDNWGATDSANQLESSKVRIREAKHADRMVDARCLPKDPSSFALQPLLGLPVREGNRVEAAVQRTVFSQANVLSFFFSATLTLCMRLRLEIQQMFQVSDSTMSHHVSAQETLLTPRCGQRLFRVLAELESRNELHSAS